MIRISYFLDFNRGHIERELYKNFEATSNENKALRAEILKLENRVLSLNKENRELYKNFEATSNENKALRAEILKLENRVLSLNKENRELYKNFEATSNENKALRAEILKLENRVLSLNRESINYITPEPRLGNKSQMELHNRANKQCLILGWYGASNYGDELMLDILLKKIRKPNIDITVLFDPHSRYNFNQWEKIFPCYPPESMESLDSITDFYDEIIIGGGAHLDDNECTDLNFIPYLATELSILAIKKIK